AVRTVAFSASLMPTKYTSSGYGVIGPFAGSSILIHGHIITNIGDAYNPKTVLQQWTQDAAPQDANQRRLPHRTLPTGRCPQDVSHRRLPHRTLPTGRCPQDAAHRTLPTGCCPQDAAPQDASHRAPPHRTLPTGRCLFLAPVKGVYFFTFTTYSWVKKADIGASLYRNQEEMLQIWEYQDDGDNEDYATNSAVLILEPGDSVYIGLHKGFQVASSAKANITMMQKMKLLVLMLAVQLLWVNPSMEDSKEYKELSKRIEEVKRSCQVRKVVFSASLRPSVYDSSGFGKIGPYSSKAILAHKHIITNIGNAYNPYSGVFTAPVRGVYFFTFTTYSWVKEANIGASLYRNQQEMLQIWEHQDSGDNEDYATNSAALILEKGDTVYLLLHNDFQVAASVNANVHTFSGFLLYQL
ncbi:hypothetical protein NFI96_013656, partial [Prochilodus magdalenae]